MSAAPTIPWEQYQQLPPDQRRRPLTDAEYAALTKQQRIAAGLEDDEQGAPANFNGPVFPNPTHIQPRADTDPAIEPTRLPQGVTFQRGNWSGTPQMDISNPAAADVQPEMGREVGADFGDGKKMSAQPIDFSKYETAAPGGGGIDFSKYEKGANSGNAAQPSVMQVLTQPTDKTDKEYMGYTGPAGVVGATVHGLSDVAQGTKDAIKGAYESFATPPQDAGEKGVFLLGGPPALQTYRMLRGLGHTASDATHVAAAIHDINQSPDPLGTYANAAEKTAAQGAGQALVAIGTEGAAKVPGAISDVAAGVKPALAKAGNAATAVGESLDPDIVGLVSPRAAHGLRLAAKVGKVATKLGGEAATEAAAGAGELDATGENRDYAGAPAPKPTPVLDATGENKPFAGGMDEYVAPKPKAPRTIVTDPATGRPEFSDVVEAKQQAAAPIETKAPPTETPAPQVAPKGTPAETPGPAADDLLNRLKTNAAQIAKEELTAPGSADEDLTKQLEDSLAIVRARKAAQAAGKSPGGASGTTATVPGQGETPRFVYRARDPGESGVPLTQEHAQATSDLNQAMKYAEPGQRGEGWGQVVRIDLSKLEPKDFVVKTHPDGMKWVQFKRPLTEDEVTPFAGQAAGAKQNVNPVQVGQ